MKCIIVIPEGKIAHGKLAQAVAYGAEIISIEGNFDDALKAVRNIAAEEPITLVNTVNPYRIEGQNSCLKFVTTAKCTRCSSYPCWECREYYSVLERLL